MNHLTATLLVLCFLSTEGRAQTLDDYKNTAAALSEKFDASAATIIPKADPSQTMTVDVDINMAAINKLDEVHGYLEISGYLTLSWIQEAYTLTPFSIEFLVSSTVVWKPPLLLVNSIKATSEIGDTSSKVRYTVDTQQCVWKPWVIFRGSCSPDVTYYPFDQQTCSFKLAAWGHTSSELSLGASSSSWSKEFFEENGEWEVKETSVVASTENNISMIEFQIVLKRRPLYYIMNLISPVIILSVLNVLVFILPADSGERIGFSVTCFLSYVVLLNTIMAFLPTTSSNMSYLSYYTFVMMLFSAGMSLGAITTLRIHHKSEDDPFPAPLRCLLYCLRCKCFKQPSRPSPRTTGVAVVTVSGAWEGEDDDSKGDKNPPPYNDDTTTDNDHRKIASWKKVARVLDIVLFLGFLAAQVIYSVSYLVPIILNA